MRPGPGSAYEEVERRAGDWAVAAVGASVWVEGGRITDAGIGLSALGDVLRASRAEEALRGGAPSDELFDRAAKTVAEDCSPATDQRGSEEYKRHLAAELTRRALRRAADRVPHSEEA
jgi:carbon-monoxide dehydrogenase medium subunit